MKRLVALILISLCALVSSLNFVANAMVCEGDITSCNPYTYVDNVNCQHIVLEGHASHIFNLDFYIDLVFVPGSGLMIDNTGNSNPGLSEINCYVYGGDLFMEFDSVDYTMSFIVYQFASMFFDTNYDYYTIWGEMTF